MSQFNKWFVPQQGEMVEDVGSIVKVVAWWPDFKAWKVRTDGNPVAVTVNGPYRIGDGPYFWRKIASR